MSINTRAPVGHGTPITLPGTKCRSRALLQSLSLSPSRLSPLPRRPEPQPSRLEYIDRERPPHVKALLLNAELVPLRRPPAAAAAPAAPLAAHVDAAVAGAPAARRARPSSLGGRLRGRENGFTSPRSLRTCVQASAEQKEWGG